MYDWEIEDNIQRSGKVEKDLRKRINELERKLDKIKEELKEAKDEISYWMEMAN